MEYKLDLGMWNRVFAVPCALVDRHLKLAGKEQLQAILYILRNSGESFSPEGMADALGMSLDSALDALQYWEDRGLLAISGETLHPIPQAENPAGDTPISPAPSSVSDSPDPEPSKPALPPKKRMVRPDGAHLAARLQESEDIRFLFQEAEATFGKTISPAMSSLLLTICDDYGLPIEVTVMLLHYAKDVGKTGTAYIDAAARDWAESGIFTLEAAEGKLRELSEKNLAWGQVRASAGIPKRAPTKKEEELALRWVREWGFSQEMLSAAYERCADNTGKFSAPYMNKVLASWHKEGIRNLDELSQAEQKRTKEKQKESAASYDIDELERMSKFDLPEDL